LEHTGHRSVHRSLIKSFLLLFFKQDASSLHFNLLISQIFFPAALKTEGSHEKD